jgi:outer membrane protein insertion porin family
MGVLALCGLIAGVAATGWPRPAAAQSEGTVRQVVVEGVQRVEPESVRSYLLVQEGDPFDESRIDRSLKSLFATGLFADVSIVRRGDTLVVRVVENPVINRVAFEGNRELDDETLESEVSLRPRTIYTRTKVQNDVRRIQTLYRREGRFAASVEPKIIQLPENRVDLVFEIEEGPTTLVESIRFVGNNAFSDSELRSEIRTRERAWWRFFTTEDTYDPDRLTLDQELLRRFYLSEGYADFRVVSATAELTPDRREFFIVFTIDEGDRYRFGDVRVEPTLRGLDTAAVSDVVAAEAGNWYNADEIEKTIDDLGDAVVALGYPFVEVRPRISRNREEKTIDVVFEVGEGPRVFVERIDITGNVRTAEKVIRREFRFVEGDPFNVSKLRKTRQSLRNLDFFQKVDVEQVPGTAADQTVVKVNVEEKSTGSLSLGAGFSTTSGAIGDVTLRERNLLGRGQDLRLRLVIAQRDSQLSLSFTEPYFLDRQIVAGFDVFRITIDRVDESSYQETTTGGALRFGYPITDHLSQSWRYSYKHTSISDVPSDASPFILLEEGDSDTSELTHTLRYDRRDSRISPTEGYLLSLDTTFAGIGGNVRFVKNVAEAAHYTPITEKLVLGILASAGYVVGIGDDVPLFDRFFVGGDNLRGFRTAGIGPRDIVSDDALGGEWYYTVTTELSFPLPLPEEFPIRGRVFADLGSTGDTPYSSSPRVADTGAPRVSLGTGVTWTSPFGPIGVDLGFPVIKEDFDKEELFRVNFGTRF